MTLSLMKAGFTACGALPAGHPLKEYEMYKDWMNTHDASEYLLQFARDCGLPASTVKLTRETACSGTLVHPSWVLAPAECVAHVYNKIGKINVVLGTVNNCLEEHTSSTVIFHPGFQFATGGSNAAMIKLETPSKHPPVQLYHTGTVGFESCDGSSRLLQVKPQFVQENGKVLASPASIDSVQV